MTSLHYVLLYGALCLALWGANVHAWRWAERAPMRAGEPRAGCTYELAILSGGPRLAVAVAVAMLLRGGSLSEGGAAARLVAAEPPVDGAHPLERAVFEAARRNPQVTVKALKRDLERSVPIERMVAKLRQEGLLIDARKIAWVRLLWLAGPPLLVALGGARLATTWDYYGDQWMRVLLIGVLWTAAVSIFHVVDQVSFDGRPLPTARGRVAQEVGEPRDPPTGGRDPDALLALAVARNGESELWRIDPQLAAALGAPREAASAIDAEWSCG